MWAHISVSRRSWLVLHTQPNPDDLLVFMLTFVHVQLRIAISILKNFQTAANEVENYDWRDGDDDDDGKLSRVLL